MDRDKHNGSFTDTLNVIKFQPRINELEEEIYNKKYKNRFDRFDPRSGRLLAKRDSGQLLSKEDDAYLLFRLVKQYSVEDAEILAKINSGQHFSIEEKKELQKSLLKSRFASWPRYYQYIAELEVKKDVGIELSLEDKLYLEHLRHTSRTIARLRTKRDLGETTQYENAYLKYIGSHYPSNIAELCAKKECGYKLSKKEHLLVQLYENEFKKKISNLLAADTKGEVSSVFDIIFLEGYKAGIDKHTAFEMAVRECVDISNMCDENSKLYIRRPFSYYEIYANSFMRPLIHDGKIRAKVNKMMKQHMSIAKG